MVEKTPHSVGFAEHLLTAFPRARLLYVTRHPVNTLGSYWRRNAIDPLKTWTGISVDRFCSRWETSATLARRHAERHPNSFLTVRYEEFTDAPDKTFEAICDFIGEPFAADAIVAVPAEHPAWDIDPHLFGSIVRRTKLWEDHVGIADARAVEDRLSDTMAMFGYERYT